MKALIVSLAALLTLPVTAMGEECEYIGSWLGYDASGQVAWTSQAHGKNSSHGTVLLELPGFDWTFGEQIEVANYTGNLKGVWVRTGGKTYSIDGNGIATDATGAAVYVIRLSCDISLADDCDVLNVTDCQAMVYFLDPVNDPIPVWDRDPDLGPIDYDPHNGYRMLVE